MLQKALEIHPGDVNIRHLLGRWYDTYMSCELGIRVKDSVVVMTTGVTRWLRYRGGRGRWLVLS